MTRETKIGLLVGLAFIIVIGILLSDYNRIETPNAPLYEVRDSVVKGVVAPGSTPRVSTTIVYPPAPVTPRGTVPTVAELAPQNNSSDEVTVRPGGQLATHDELPSRGVVIAPGNSTSGETQAAQRGVPANLQEAARKGGVEIVSVTPGKENASISPRPVAPVAGKQYTAEAGDTVSKMAGRFMGGNTKANRDAIVAANPSLQKNINNVIVGRAYVIPSATAPAATPQATAPAKPQQLALAPATQAPVNQPQSTPTHWYTVKENDSLWRIAQDQLGDGNAVTAIKELNKDVLKGRDDLRPNMRLRLPAKPLASAS